MTWTFRCGISCGILYLNTEKISKNSWNSAHEYCEDTNSFLNILNLLLNTRFIIISRISQNRKRSRIVGSDSFLYEICLNNSIEQNPDNLKYIMR